MERAQIKNIIEAMLFVSDKPLFLSEIKNVMEGPEVNEIKDVIAELAGEYEKQTSALKIKEIAGGYQIVTDPVLAPWLKRLYKTAGSDRLSGPSLETLAIIAYKQPASKPEIEAIRGVNVDGVLKTLIEKNLVRILGRRETIGRPIIYGTTQEFLQYFGLNSLKELPKLEEFNFTEKDIELPEHFKREEEAPEAIKVQEPDVTEELKLKDEGEAQNEPNQSS